MNKIVILALVALACQFASAAPNFSVDNSIESSEGSKLRPTDEQETSGLNDATVIFKDFCLSQRDYVLDEAKSTVHGAASTIFSLFLKSAQNVGEETLAAQKMAAEKLAAQLENPEKPIADPEEANEVERIIYEGQKEIEETQSAPKAFFKAIVTSLEATKSVITRNIAKGLETIKKTANVQQLLDGVELACAKLDGYEQSIRSNFDEFKSVIGKTEPRAAMLNLEDVKCVTTIRVLTLDGVCKLVKAAQDPFQKIAALVTQSPNLLKALNE